MARQLSNVSLQHEAPLTVLRRSPAFVRELIVLLGQAPVAGGETVIVDADLTKLAPTTRHADLVSVIKGLADDVRAVIVVEVQRDVDRKKPEAWLSYIAHLAEKYEAPVTLLVVAFEPTVADWARGPHSVGPCVNVVPLVLSGSDLPEIQTEADALAHPQQAMLTALARFEEARSGSASGRARGGRTHLRCVCGLGESAAEADLCVGHSSGGRPRDPRYIEQALGGQRDGDRRTDPERGPSRGQG